MADDDEEKARRRAIEEAVSARDAWTPEADGARRIERLDDAVQGLVARLQSIEARIDDFEESVDAMLDDAVAAAGSFDRLATSVHELRVDITRVQAQVKILYDIKEGSATSKAFALIDNPHVRNAFYVAGGYVASRWGPAALRTLTTWAQALAAWAQG